MPVLNVVALISGGKDSLFSILHCQANGHKIIALANLHPGEATGNAEDIDSYMYQTVGHSMIPLYEEALGLPLCRQAIVGSAVDASQCYAKLKESSNPGVEEDIDETESLLPLLQRVKAAHPEVNAVSSGAILSTYQRTRLESVALRLGLVPLAFLWQYPLLPSPGQTSLLEDMAAIGMDARIIKVASGGLDESHLWLNVANDKTIAKLKLDMGRFGKLSNGSVLGEGGEYETLAVDGPAPLWKRRIVVQDKMLEIVFDEGGTAILRIGRAALAGKEDDGHPRSSLRIPDLLDAQFKELLEKLPRQNHEQESFSRLEPSLRSPTNALASFQFAQRAVEEHVFIANLSYPSSSDIEHQLRDILSQLISRLTALELTPDNIILTTILLRSMADFAQVNTLYSTLFTRPNPPARVTVACGNTLPAHTLITISVIASKCLLSTRGGLHVQSQSYWAPANIGPYSQAITNRLLTKTPMTNLSRLVYVAGQIPLVPRSMELEGGPFARQAVLALQHLWRVGRAMDVHCWTGSIAYITAADSEEGENRAKIALALWQLAHTQADVKDEERDSNEDESFDIGNAHLRRPWLTQHSGKDANVLAPIPDWTRITCVDGGFTSCFVAQVSELPRGASIEWVSQGLSLGTDEQGRGAKAQPIMIRRAVVFEEMSSETCFCYGVARNDEEIRYWNGWMEDMSEAGADLQVMEAYTTSKVSEHHLEWMVHHGAQIIPCMRLWDEEGEAIFAAKWRYVFQVDQFR